MVLAVNNLLHSATFTHCSASTKVRIRKCHQLPRGRRRFVRKAAQHNSTQCARLPWSSLIRDGRAHGWNLVHRLADRDRLQDRVERSDVSKQHPRDLVMALYQNFVLLSRNLVCGVEKPIAILKEFVVVARDFCRLVAYVLIGLLVRAQFLRPRGVAQLRSWRRVSHWHIITCPKEYVEAPRLTLRFLF